MYSAMEGITAKRSFDKDVVWQKEVGKGVNDMHGVIEAFAWCGFCIAELCCVVACATD